MTAHDPLPPGKYRLRVSDYEMLAEAGVFGDQRTELIEGDVIVMSPQFRPHGFAKTELYDQLRDALRAIQSPLRAMQEVSVDLSAFDSMPLPDILLTSEPRGQRAVPLPSVALIVEIADSSLPDDLTVKTALYGGASVPEFWVVDVNGRIIHQRWKPSQRGYDETTVVRFGDPLIARTVPGLTIATDGL